MFQKMKNNDSVLDETLDDDIWKDSFDKLLNKRSLLREQKLIKSNVRLSFNNDSSIEVSKNNISKHVNLEENKNENNGKRKAAGSISTPILVHKMYGPFDCPLSPISSWRLTHFNQRDTWNSSCKEISSVPEKASLIQLSTPLTCSSKNLNASQLGYPAISTNIPKLRITVENVSDQNISNNSSPPRTVANEENINVLLPPGKWRKSLTVWKRLNQNKHECQPLRVCSNRNSHSIINYSHLSYGKPHSTLHNPNIKKSQTELLKVSRQKEFLCFSTLYSNTALRKCRKIGEGTYGEVFLNSCEGEDTVLKIIPIEGDFEINGEPQKTFEQILPEVIITNELSNLKESQSFKSPGFVFLKNVRCLKGEYPVHLLELWNLYEQNYGSENDHPGIFKSNQLYVSLEIAYGGKDLDGFIFRNSEQAYATFLQVLFSLAVAEKYLEFEHRDLHCGNILIQPTTEKHVEYIVNSKKIDISSCGVKVTIIDYTLSRMLVNNFCYYNDLSEDEGLFCAKGDYQYDIYRLMRSSLKNNWEKHKPQTNVMWLHYLLTKLIDQVKYKNSKSKIHKQYIDKMKKIQNTILSYNSAFDFANTI